MLNSSIDPLEILADALKDKRPLVLFAGQSLDSAYNAILGALLDHSGYEDHNSGWRTALDQGMSATDMTWLSERFDRSVPSDAASSIFDVAWSAVFTSSIDPQFARRFETRGRQPESVLSKMPTQECRAAVQDRRSTIFLESPTKQSSMREHPEIIAIRCAASACMQWHW